MNIRGCGGPHVRGGAKRMKTLRGVQIDSNNNKIVSGERKRKNSARRRREHNTRARVVYSKRGFAHNTTTRPLQSERAAIAQNIMLIYTFSSEMNAPPRTPFIIQQCCTKLMCTMAHLLLLLSTNHPAMLKPHHHRHTTRIARALAPERTMGFMTRARVRPCCK